MNRWVINQQRKDKITGVVSKRQYDLHVVLENIHDPHNVSAIFRSCDAAGIPLVSLLYTFEKFPKIGKKSSASAYKWVDKQKFSSAPECFQSLREQGFTIYATAIRDDAVNLYDVDFTRKSAIIMGNEHRGVSEEIVELADKALYIPMMGMVQSLNVSVATAVVLFEAVRQRYKAGLYDNPNLPVEEFLKELERYSNK
ncbi:MAG: RNA methyltransferase [Ignavibacteria bacterium]|nr:RNA methyltransferase [Ignavibacteria bacterium]